MSAREPRVGEFVRLGDGRGSIVTLLYGPTLRADPFRDSANAGDFAVTVEHRGGRIVYVERMNQDEPAEWLAGGEDFDDVDPYRQGGVSPRAGSDLA